MEELKVFFKDMKIILKNDFLGVTGIIVLLTIFSGSVPITTFLLMPTLLFVMLLLLKSGFNYVDKTDNRVIKIFIISQVKWLLYIIASLLLDYLIDVFGLKQPKPSAVSPTTIFDSFGYAICSVLSAIGFMFMVLADYTIRFFTQGSKIGKEYYYKFSNLPKVIFWSIQLLFVGITYYSAAYHKHLYDWFLPIQAFLNIYFTYKYLLGNDLQPKKKAVKIGATKDEHELQFV